MQAPQTAAKKAREGKERRDPRITAPPGSTRADFQRSSIAYRPTLMPTGVVTHSEGGPGR